MAADQAGDFVRAVSRVADEEEGSLGELQQHQPQQPTQKLGRRAMGPVSFAVVFLGVVEVHSNGQCPRSRGEREGDQGQPWLTGSDKNPVHRNCLLPWDGELTQECPAAARNERRLARG